MVIVDQIKQRETMRIREKELQEKEKQQMLQQMEQLSREEQIIADKKRDDARRLMLEVEEANKDSMGKKLEEKEKEKL